MTSKLGGVGELLDRLSDKMSDYYDTTIREALARIQQY